MNDCHGDFCSRALPKRRAFMKGAGLITCIPIYDCITIAIVVMQMVTHVQISKIILYLHIPLTVSAQKK